MLQVLKIDWLLILGVSVNKIGCNYSYLSVYHFCTQLIDLQGKYGLLQQELVEREQTLAEAQMTFHNFQQSHSIVEHDLKESQKVLLIIRVYYYVTKHNRESPHY